MTRHKALQFREMTLTDYLCQEKNIEDCVDVSIQELEEKYSTKNKEGNSSGQGYNINKQKNNKN